MTVEEFVAANPGVLDEGNDLRPDRVVANAYISEPIGFEYIDPKGRFELSYPSVGNAAHPTRVVFSSATRLGHDVMAVTDFDVFISDGAPCDGRIDQAVMLHKYLEGRSFQQYEGMLFKSEAGEVFATFERYAASIKGKEVGRFGHHLFAVSRDELVVSVGLLRHRVERGECTLHVGFSESRIFRPDLHD